MSPKPHTGQEEQGRSKAGLVATSSLSVLSNCPRGWLEARILVLFLA